MSTINQLIQQFQALSFEDKKAKLIHVFEGLKGTQPVFEEVLDALYNNPNVDDEFLNSSYETVITLANNIDELQKSHRVEDMGEKLQKNMAFIREKEAQASLQENAEDVLSALESTPQKKSFFLRLKQFFGIIG